MNEVLKRIREVGIAPVAALPAADDAVPMARALLDGGLSVAEVTFRTSAAAEGIARMKGAFPEMLVGAGTVLTVGQVDAALDAGAEFIVSPGFEPTVVDYCLDRGVPVLPGFATASELTQIVLRKLPAAKFFPAESMGGLKMLKGLAAPFPPMEFMVTGGLSLANMGSYLAWDRVLAVGGSWMVEKSLVAAGKFDEIAALAGEAVREARNYRE